MGNNRRALVSHPSGVLNVVETDDPPPPANDEILLDIECCALNFADLLMIEGRYQANPPFPLTPGLEVSGFVASVGDTVSEFKPGMRVAAQTDGGGLASRVLVHKDRVLQLPDEIDFETAASFQIAHGTSHLALTRRARLTTGETLVVLGAAGGVGLTAVEIGKAVGAQVIAVARGDERLAICEAHGADIMINSAKVDDLREAILKCSRSDVVYDAVGGPEGIAAQRTLKPEGRHLLIGFASGDLPELKPNHLLVKNLDVLGVNWNQYIQQRPALVAETLKELLSWMKSGRISPPHIGATYTLDDAAQAIERLKSRSFSGKIVVKP